MRHAGAHTFIPIIGTFDRGELMTTTGACQSPVTGDLKHVGPVSVTGLVVRVIIAVLCAAIALPLGADASFAADDAGSISDPTLRRRVLLAIVDTKGLNQAQAACVCSFA